MEPFFATSHGANRDEDLALKRSGIWEWWLLMMLSWNLLYGPHDSFSGMQQISEAMQHLFQSSSMLQNPVCMEMAPMLIRAMEKNGECFMDDRPKEEQMWHNRQAT
eukprot:4759922-Lingulodinium_polyedra.AAC.1